MDHKSILKWENQSSTVFKNAVGKFSNLLRHRVQQLDQEETHAACSMPPHRRHARQAKHL